MRSFLRPGLALVLGLWCTSSWAQGFNSPSLLSPATAYPIARTGYGMGDDLPSPSDTPAPAPASPQMGLGYNAAPASDWGGPTVGQSYLGGDIAGECGDCGLNGGCNNCRRGGWFGYAGGLIMTRSHTGGHALAYNNLTRYESLNTNQVEQPWMGGFEASFGKWFCGCNVGVEAVYWGLFPDQLMADVSGSPANGYPTTTMNMNGLEYNARPFGDYWDTATRQYIRRENLFQNVEVNLIGNAWNTTCGGGSCGDACGSSCGSGYSPLSVGWLAGFRYFQFNDNLFYASDDGDGILDGDVDEVFYTNNIRNQLYGFQMGGYINYQFACRWSVYGGAKAGVFNNHISSYKRLYGTLGDATVAAGYPDAGRMPAGTTDSDNLSMLGQLDLGIRWQATCNFAMRFGYRVVGVSGVALTENQISPVNYDMGNFYNTDSNGGLLLHGAYAGAEFCW